MGGDPSQREILASIPWPDVRQRIKNAAEAASSLSSGERLDQVDELRRLGLELAEAAGNLDAVQRCYEWRESQWLERIREAIRLYERKHTRSGA